MPTKLSKLPWYWHRLRAMGPGEVALRFQKKAYQFSDKKFSRASALPAGLDLSATAAFPKLPDRSKAPPELLDGLRASAAEILSGKFRFFGHLPLQVDDPPNWHRDHLVGKDFRSTQSAFTLDHRAQPGGADIKIIWEPSRWYQLVRLAMAAWLLDHTQAQEKCIQWLHDWNKNNPPFTGLNWTSGLEVGMRLVNFTWIDALLTAAGVPQKTLQELRTEILPPHIWYAWRYKSFGSSANNHLIGELAGLILALARWPDLAKISAPLKDIAALFEREVLLQFAPSGCNNEQALSYHLFSWEFSWQCQQALSAAGFNVSRQVEQRLHSAGYFYAGIKPENDPWDFGDSDNAYVTPLFADEATFASEWWRWFRDAKSSPALCFWWGDVVFKYANEHLEHCLLNTGDWIVRFDLSPLGYLSMAPHGHLDALHVSIWFRNEPVIIDPGTGAYYADKVVRDYLADWAAHNGPHLRTPPKPYPRRFGTFLWSAHHQPPFYTQTGLYEVTAVLELPYGRAVRTVAYMQESDSIRITDTFQHSAKTGPVTTRWKFAPEFSVKNSGPNDFVVGSPKCAVRLSASPGWTSSQIFNPPDELRGKTATSLAQLGSIPIQALVSPAFRSLAAASYLNLESSGEGPFILTISPA